MGRGVAAPVLLLALIHPPSWKRSFPPKFGSTLFGRISLTPPHRYDASMISASLPLKAPEASPS
jgi:hypothetical protein